MWRPSSMCSHSTNAHHMHYAIWLCILQCYIWWIYSKCILYTKFNSDKLNLTRCNVIYIQLLVRDQSLFKHILMSEGVGRLLYRLYIVQSSNYSNKLQDSPWGCYKALSLCSISSFSVLQYVRINTTVLHMHRFNTIFTTYMLYICTMLD